MARPAPKRGALVVGLSAAFVMITLLTGALAMINQNPYADKPASSAVEVLEPVEDSTPEDQDPPAEDPAEDLDAVSSAEEEPPTESQPPPEQPPAVEQPVSFNVPDQLRAVKLTAGWDYLTTPENTARATIASQIDQALNNAKELTMNAVIIDTKYNDDVLFSSSALPMVKVDLDCVDYAVKKARELGLYVYATYDVTDLADDRGAHLRAASADGHTLDEIAANVGEFAEKYDVDGILLSNYENPPGASSYAQYNRAGGGMGYENYLRQVPGALVNAAAASVRTRAPGTQVGLLVGAVWENSTVNPAGSETTATYTSLTNGSADTKAMVESGMFDFVMVDNSDSTSPTEKAEFRTVANWWSKVAAAGDTTLYMLHSNEKLGNVPGGWSVMEQLSKQVIDLGKIEGIAGSAFNSLKALMANPGNTTTTLVQYMNNQIDESWVLTQLSISKPAELTYKTKEPSVTFQGASDPQADVTLNGEVVPRNESGYFTISEELKEGLNTFAIVHKGKTFTYNITREIIVLKEIQPIGSIAVDGGMAVTVTALAYSGSTVTASVGGQNITLSPSQTEGDSTDRDSSYLEYVGVFTAPTATSASVSMGTITVTATSADGVSKTLEGASVTVNKKAQMGDGVVVQVSADQAETFPINTLNDNSNANHFPLPQGTVDKTYGAEIVYKNGTNTYSYWNLESGVRVYSKDITTGGQMPDNNKISEMSVKSAGAYTTIQLTTGSKVPYKVSYDGNKLVFQFEYTASVPESQTFGSSNALFKSAEWSGSSLTLHLKKTGGFLGYKAYYDGATKLVLRFNNSPGSLSGARVVVDPGHGGNDPGTLGFYPGKDERDVNLAIAKKLVNELKGRGATVLMLEPGSTMASRLTTARAFNPQVLVSVHNNSSPNANAKGTEVYYFYPFQKALAANVAANVSASLSTENRGAKQGLYYMTRESQFACVLAEVGFMSNENEYTKLINSKYQTRVAEGMANAISGYLGGVNSGGGTSTGEDEEEETSSKEEDEEDEEESTEGVSLNKKQISMKAGDTFTLKAAAPSGAKLKWSSDDTSVATVSSSGKVTAKSEGVAYITVEAGGETAECEVEVGGSSGGSGGDLSLNKDTLKLSQGSTAELTANKTVKWTSEDTSIATVSSTGKVTAVSEGETWITATLKSDSSVSVDCEVTVTPRGTGGGNIKSISISGPASVAVGSRIELSAAVSPTNAADPGVKWSSSSGVVELTQIKDANNQLIDNQIKVEGVRNGTVTITATAYDEGKVKATHTIKVGTGVNSAGDSSSSGGGASSEPPRKGVLVSSIKISGSATISKGQRGEYTATVSPSFAEDTGVKWTVSDPEILVLTTFSGAQENTCKVEGGRTGTATLTATSFDESKTTQTFKIKVVA